MDVFWPPIWSALGNKNSRPCGRLFLKYVRRRPTLPPRHQGSTIGAERLSFRVRNGTGRFPLAMTTETLWSYQSYRSKNDANALFFEQGSRPYLGNRTVDACKKCV